MPSMSLPAPTAPATRPALAAIRPYRAGRRATSATTAPLASNESHFGPLPSVVAAVADATAHANRYPDPAAVELRAAIARHTATTPEEIAVGTGSVAILQQILMAYCDAGDEVVFAWRSFEAYPILVALAGARAVEVPLTADGRHDLSAMAAAITDRTRVVFVCTPNNPTGTAITEDELSAFLDTVPPHVLVVIDEAYLEFADGSLDTRLLRCPNVVLLRTFSKAHGLAGLRVGYAIAEPEVADALRRTALPFSVSAPAQAAAIASLLAHDELRARVLAATAERDRVACTARSLGWTVPDTQANFIWVPTPGRVHDRLVKAFAAADIIVRPFPAEGIRITIADPSANDRVLAVLADLTGGSR